MRRFAWIPVVAALGFSLAACSSSSHKGASTTTASTVAPVTTPANGSSTTTPTNSVVTTPPTSATTVATVSGCTASELSAALTKPNGAAGTVYYSLTLTNSSTVTCTLKGYPGVSFVTGSGGKQIGAAATRSPGSEPMVTLAPGKTAVANLGIVEAGNYGAHCDITTVHGLRVYPPGSTSSLYVAHDDQACADTSFATLKVQPVQAAQGS